jgi:hypothetical protein
VEGLMAHLNVQLFNQLLLRPECCSCSNARCGAARLPPTRPRACWQPAGAASSWASWSPPAFVCPPSRYVLDGLKELDKWFADGAPALPMASRRCLPCCARTGPADLAWAPAGPASGNPAGMVMHQGTWAWDSDDLNLFRPTAVGPAHTGGAYQRLMHIRQAARWAAALRPCSARGGGGVTGAAAANHGSPPHSPVASQPAAPTCPLPPTAAAPARRLLLLEEKPRLGLAELLEDYCSAMSEQQVYRLCTTFCDDQGTTGNFPGERRGLPRGGWRAGVARRALGCMPRLSTHNPQRRSPPACADAAARRLPSAARLPLQATCWRS